MKDDIPERDFVGSRASTFIRLSLAIVTIVPSAATACAESSVLPFVSEDSFVG
jgi:hypothetical protein